MAKIVIINEVEPRELPLILDKVLGDSQCPIMRSMGRTSGIDISGGVVVGSGSLSDFLKGLGINIGEQPKPNDKNNKGGKAQ